MAWIDDEPAGLPPSAELAILRGRRARRTTYAIVSAGVLVAASVSVAALLAHDVPTMRVLLILALGFILGGAVNLAIAIVQLLATVRDLAGVRAQIAAGERDHAGEA